VSEITPQEMKLAETIGVLIGKGWKNVEIDDVIGNLYLWLVENRKYLDAWRELEDGEAKLYVALRREAAKFCAREEAARVNRPLDANPAYPVAALDRALPLIFEEAPEMRLNVNPVSGAAIPSHSSDTGLARAIYSDISSAFYELPKDDQLLITLYYREGLTHREIGELRGVTTDGARRQVNRALKRLSVSLGSSD